MCNVLWFLFDHDPSAADLITIADMLKSWWVGTRRDITSNTVSLDAIEVRGMTTSSSPSIEYTTGLPSVGANNGAALPNHVTAAVKLTTGMGGRSGKGRQYLIGITSSLLVDPNHLAPTVVATYKAQYEDLITRAIANDSPLVIASFFHNLLPRAAAVLTPVIAASVNATLDSQRRRLPERGS